MWTLYEGDCLDVMKQLPNESIDVVITDPPYNASNSKISCIDKHYTTIDEDWDKGFNVRPFMEESIRILKPNGSILVFCSHHLLGEYLTNIPIKLQQIIHWIKTNPFPAIAKVYTPNVEYICWYVKGSPYVFNKKYANQNIITTNVCQGKERTIHPSQKPLKLIEKLVLIHTNAGDTILDPFAGSGTTGVAAEKCGRNSILIEKESKYCEIIRKRLNEPQNMRLFDAY